MSPSRAQTTRQVLTALQQAEPLKIAAARHNNPDELQAFVFWLADMNPDLFPGIDRVSLSFTNWVLLFDQLRGAIRYYGINDTAEILGVSRSTIYTYIREGKLRPERLGKRYAFTLAAIDDFLEPR